MSYSQDHPDNMELRAMAIRTISQHFQNQVDIAHVRIKKDPNDVAAYALMARTLMLAGENSSALGILTEGVIENPKSVDLWIQIGALEVGSGRDSEAISVYQEAIRLEHHNGLARNNLAFLLVTTKNPILRDPILALIHAQQALELEPENPAFLDTLAEVFNETGHHHRAVRTIKRAIDIAPHVSLYRRQLVRFQKAYLQSKNRKAELPARAGNR
jgi:Flp pilus assembly protein TadD